jgi:hypothetical protein
VAWDEDSDTEEPKAKAASLASSTTLKPNLKLSKDQQSQPDSESSYDLVSGAPSGAPSHAPGSPKIREESDEEDWE